MQNDKSIAVISNRCMSSKSKWMKKISWFNGKKTIRIKHQGDPLKGKKELSFEVLFFDSKNRYVPKQFYENHINRTSNRSHSDWIKAQSSHIVFKSQNNRLNGQLFFCSFFRLSQTAWSVQCQNKFHLTNWMWFYP